MILCLATVRHTGSKTTRDHILKGFNTGSIKGGHVYPNTVYFDHIAPTKMKQFLPLIKKYTTLVPLRHPQDCALSWKKRGEPIKDMIEHWKTLVHVVDKEDPYYLPMGSNIHLWEFNRATGLNLHTNWPVINSHSGMGVLKRTEQMMVDKLCKDIQPFIERFYH